jgi:hypothetical protein
MTANPTEPTIDARLDALLAQARAVEDALAVGQEPETAALESGVQDVCRRIDRLPRQRGQTYLPRLQDLTDALDRIRGVLSGQLEGLGADLRQHGARQSAVRAYGRARTSGDAPDGRG